jgi:hypothetical protein
LQARCMGGSKRAKTSRTSFLSLSEASRQIGARAAAQQDQTVSKCTDALTDSELSRRILLLRFAGKHWGPRQNVATETTGKEGRLSTIFHDQQSELREIFELYNLSWFLLPIYMSHQLIPTMHAKLFIKTLSKCCYRTYGYPKALSDLTPRSSI